MRKLVVPLVAAVALGAAGAANAGCWATVGLSPLPKGVAAGETWTVSLRVLQHGLTPLPEAKPAVLVTNAQTGGRASYPARLVDAKKSRFRANVVFPSAGRWSVGVRDGFPVKECQRVHGFGTFTIPARPIDS